MIGGGRKSLASAAALALVASDKAAQAAEAIMDVARQTPAQTITRYAELLIDGIHGVGITCSTEFFDYAAGRGFAEVIDGAYQWIRPRLEACDEQELLSIYLQARKAAGRPA